MSHKVGVNGLLLESIGLTLLIIAASWQFLFSGWWDKQASEWQYSIQEEVNISVLSTLGHLATLPKETDADQLRERAWEIRQDAYGAVAKAISMRDDRKKALKGQASFFSKIWFWLFLLGSVLLCVGKYCQYLAAKLKVFSANKPIKQD